MFWDKIDAIHKCFSKIINEKHFDKKLIYFLKSLYTFNYQILPFKMCVHQNLNEVQMMYLYVEPYLKATKHVIVYQMAYAVIRK